MSTRKKGATNKSKDNQPAPKKRKVAKSKSNADQAAKTNDDTTSSTASSSAAASTRQTVPNLPGLDESGLRYSQIARVLESTGDIQGFGAPELGSSQEFNWYNNLIDQQGDAQQQLELLKSLRNSGGLSLSGIMDLKDSVQGPRSVAPQEVFNVPNPTNVSLTTQLLNDISVLPTVSGEDTTLLEQFIKSEGKKGLDIRKPIVGGGTQVPSGSGPSQQQTQAVPQTTTSAAGPSQAPSTSGSSSFPLLTTLGDTPAGVISQLAAFDQALETHLKQMKLQQREVIDNIQNRVELEKLVKVQAEYDKQITAASTKLDQLNDTHILPAPDAYRLTRLLDSFQLHSRRLRVLREELFQAQSGQPIKPIAGLVITKQPFPCTVKQSKSVDDPVEVHLLTGSKVELQNMGPVKAELINEDYNPISKKKNAAPAIQNSSEQMDENGVAVFKRLIFPHGSRVKSVNMRFGQEVTINGVLVRLQSDATKPFIVMTNHGQRSTTEGKLLKKHTFFGRTEIPWAAFANAMQLHYIRATKQDPMKPARPLSLKDIEYLHLTKFAGKTTVNQEDYDSFWAWFGTILYKIRNHQKHILPMWIKGLIYGFLSREDADRLLQTPTAEPGSFLIRFSDRCAGQFVVVYVSRTKKENGEVGREVKHYLVKPDDIEKKSTLPDFLRDCENLWWLLQLVRDQETGVISLRPRNKDDILAPYYTRERTQPLPFGYDNRQP
jgi:hypothetical protein